MELVYLWVEDYKNIKKQGFNFSSRFECKYDEASNELTIDENNDYIPDFFGENINVTAIVGKNGSGKSSVFEKLIQILNKFYIDELEISEKKIIFLVKKDNNLILSSNILDIKSILKNEKKNLLEYANFYYLNISHLERDNIIQNDGNIISCKIKYHGVYAKNDIYKSRDYPLSPAFTDFNLNQFNFLQTFEVSMLLKDDKNTNFFLDNFGIRKPKKIKIDYDEKELNRIKISNTKINEMDDRTIDESVPKKIDIILEFLDDNEIVDLESKEYYDFFELVGSVYNLEEEFKLTFVDENNNKIKFSSGEKTILFYLVQLYKIKSEANEVPSVLLFDEIETFLHPYWQKKLFNILVKFIQLQKFKKNFHFILTTHSPFLLSDIPKQNIIFLDKDEKGNCKVVDGLKEKKQTFGANIHTLLSDSFFMEDGLMGEFAKSKIDRAIKLLNQEQLNEDELKYCEQIISIIGEPIVKNQLQRMLDSKRLKKVDEIDAIKKSMIAMKQRLDELEK